MHCRACILERCQSANQDCWRTLRSTKGRRVDADHSACRAVVMETTMLCVCIPIFELGTGAIIVVSGVWTPTCWLPAISNSQFWQENAVNRGAKNPEDQSTASSVHIDKGRSIRTYTYSPSGPRRNAQPTHNSVKTFRRLERRLYDLHLHSRPGFQNPICRMTSVAGLDVTLILNVSMHKLYSSSSSFRHAGFQS